MSRVYEYNPIIEITRSLYINKHHKTLKSKCHNQKGYPFVYKQAERWLVGLGRFLACPKLDCYIIYVTNKNLASCHGSEIYPCCNHGNGIYSRYIPARCLSNGIYQNYSPTEPFDLRCQNGIYI